VVVVVVLVFANFLAPVGKTEIRRRQQITPFVSIAFRF
jgi:hypothetical protein